jgi:hypothetical protein
MDSKGSKRDVGKEEQCQRWRLKLNCTLDQDGPPLPSPTQRRNGDKGGRQMKAMATKRAMTMATRVASNDNGDGDSGKSNGKGNKVGRQATMRAMAAAISLVGKNEGDGDGNEDGRQQRG